MPHFSYSLFLFLLLSFCSIYRKSTRLNSSHLGISYAVFFFNKNSLLFFLSLFLLSPLHLIFLLFPYTTLFRSKNLNQTIILISLFYYLFIYYSLFSFLLSLFCFIHNC